MRFELSTFYMRIIKKDESIPEWRILWICAVIYKPMQSLTVTRVKP
jgi:hypothetical protein